MRKFFMLIIFTTLTISTWPPKILHGAEIPRANLDDAERYFNNAYVHFMRRDYRDAQVYLDQALQENLYMIDYYLLSALNLSRMGDTEGAMSSIRSYLEVRPLDESAPRISRVFDEQDRILRNVINTTPVPVSWKFAKTTVQSLWETGYTRPFSIRGMGKVKALGNVVCIPDTFGDNLYVKASSNSIVSTFSRNNTVFREVKIPAPVVAFPLGDGTFLIFSDNGDLYSLSDASGTLSPDFIGPTSSLVITDAELISSHEFALADPVDRCVAFYELEDLRPIMRWYAPELPGDLLFEPVAIERYADWLAIADRANNRVYILNITSREFFYINGIPEPRDLIWSTLGELFILTENGTVYDFIIDFGTRTFANRNSDALDTGLDNIWSFFHSPEGDICGIDIGASMLYKFIVRPSREDVPGFLGMYNPVTAANVENRESFIIDATFMTPFIKYSQNTSIIAQSVWNERSMRCNIMWQRPKNFDGLFIHRPMPRGEVLPLNLRPAGINTGSDIRTVIPAFWLLHKDTLTNIIVDASIPFTMDDILALLKFCMLNGLELDIYAREIPSLGLTRASGFTGGKTIYSLKNAVELPVQRTHLQIQIPLPEELSSSGYPGRSMLAMYLDAGLIQSRAWVPLWPDMFTR